MDMHFSDADRISLGNIAEAARSFLHVRPCTRGQFDAWQNAIKTLTPTIGPPVELPPEPEEDTRSSAKK